MKTQSNIPTNNCLGCADRDRINHTLATEVDRLTKLLDSTNLLVTNEAVVPHVRAEARFPAGTKE